MKHKSIVEQIDNIKSDIESAFENGAIDFNDITAKLDSIREEVSADISDNRHEQRTLEPPSDLIRKSEIKIDEYR